MKATFDTHVSSVVPLVPPGELKAQLPMTARTNKTIVEAREAIQAILDGTDPRLMVVVGPCSIHDADAALEYAQRLAVLAQALSDRLLIVMRVYFEKPRTTIGWKGLINDPHMDGSFDMAEGLRRARQILLAVNELGLPAASEMLDPISPQFTADLIAWASIGARTTESQTHRQMASGLSMPVGFKNGTDGNLQIALDAMQACRSPHAFLGIDADGRTCIVNTTGNQGVHLILRGGNDKPNYEAEHVAQAMARLEKSGLPQALVIDCSHANSNKDYRLQAVAFRDALAQRRAGNANIVGLMLESNLNEGRQNLGADPSALQRGVSVTDACISWEQTDALLREAHAALAPAPSGSSAESSPAWAR